MKITAVFGTSLYAVHYDGVEENEYDQLIHLWEDILYIYSIANQHRLPNKVTFAKQILKDLAAIQDFMNEVQEGLDNLDQFFKPLYNMESGFRELSLQKGSPNKKSCLRLYAIRIDKGTYLITGGGIKLVATMQQDEVLMREKSKLNTVRQFLKSNYVFDGISFQDFIKEQDENE